MERTFVFESKETGVHLLLVGPDNAIPWKVLDCYIKWHNDWAEKEASSDYRYLYSSCALDFVEELKNEKA